MTTIAHCLLALCQVGFNFEPPPPAFADLPADNAAVVQIAPIEPQAPRELPPVERARQPLSDTSALADEGVRIGRRRAFKGGKLLLTNGVSTIEGSSGGGIARWATIGGRQTPGGIGISGHAAALELPDFGGRVYGVAVGFGDRLELSFARADLDTREAGAELGLGLGYTFNQDVYGAKLRVTGDLVYGASWQPQIAVGIEHKRSRDGATVRMLGAADSQGTDFTLSATKLLLAQSLLVNATLRFTEANQLGLLGFGSAAGAGYRLQFEGSLGYQLSRRALIGAEYRSKPDNLGLGEDDWMDVFAAYALNDYVTLTAAYVDLGSIATFSHQRGAFLSAQVAF